MEMPKPGPEHARLAAMVGHWTGEERIYPSPWDPTGGIATATLVSRLACEGFCVVTDYTEERGGRVTYVGHGVFGWDPKQQRYLQHWSDSMGGVPPRASTGTWEGDTLTFLDHGPQGPVRFIYHFTSPVAYELKMETSPDGVTWMPMMDARYARRAPAAAAVPRKAKPKKAAKKAKKPAKKKAKKAPRATKAKRAKKAQRASKAGRRARKAKRRR